MTREIIGITPFEFPDIRLTRALCRAGALGVIDLGRQPEHGLRLLREALNRRIGPIGVRIAEGIELLPEQIPAEVAAVVLSADRDLAPWSCSHQVLVQATSADEATTALRAGVAGIIAKGAESGGRVGAESAFILLQRVLALIQSEGSDVPVWCQGGMGMHTAAGAIAAGARGVVLDAQLALLRDSSLPPEIKEAVRRMEGTETTVLAGQRVYCRPDIPLSMRTDLSHAEVLARLGASDLQECLLPVGQDGALAASLAAQAPQVDELLYDLRLAIRGHLRQARHVRPLAPHSPLARAQGTRYPVVQGPMSRVSDNIDFAEAIAAQGGMPFLALALMPPHEARTLLQQTRDRLGERPFGVGMLGFVPAAIRDMHVQLIKEFRPAVVIIAGGRPSQARPLEDEGIQAYLHVPAPALLDIFLKDGARRFVFEGRECGGHVGPRMSFLLWEQQVQRLLDHERPEELSILFAGGIHDARSAAAVAAIAAPLAARGAHIGVLMGSAYITTAEAVSSGAILQQFQDAVLEAEQTTVLETAPGHATRCLQTPFADLFAARKARLVAANTSAEELWKQLEGLNLGRLRVATKGELWDGSAVQQLDAEQRREQGLYMIGQVASLRDRPTTVAELHRDVSEGATARLAELAPPESPAREQPGIDIAVVGIACMYPGAPDLASYWASIVQGKSAITDVPEERWSPDVYYDAESWDGTKTACKLGGFLADVPFAPLEYGIPPHSLAAIDPVQLLCLVAARKALDDAGYAERPFNRERTSVVLGAETGADLSAAYGLRTGLPGLLGEIPKEVDAFLPRLTEDSFPGILGNVISGRVANRLDLGGVNFTVNAACASSLAAIEVAAQELAARTSDMVLAGGADLHNGINDYLMFSSLNVLSRQGKLRAFDAAADGILLGEGVGIVVLKRLDDAEQDGDRIYAVLKGIAGSSDGKNLSLTAPCQRGQIRALVRAHRHAGIAPAEVGLVEAHGTGTVVGDRTELQTLTELYNRGGALRGACALGSVKSQIGHTKSAAGVAGLIKVVMALHHRVLPPTLNVDKPNAFYSTDNSPFQINTTARPWKDERRSAAVSAFGFGGTNFHAVVASYDPPVNGSGAPHAVPGLDEWPAELFVFRGTDREQAGQLIDALQGQLEGDGALLRLRDLAYSVARAGTGPVQVAVVAEDLEQLRDRLASARAFEADDKNVWVASEEPPGKVAFLYPGQGSQRPNMLADIFVAFAETRSVLELGEPWLDVLFPPTAFDDVQRKAQEQAIKDTRVAQPTLGMADLAMTAVLRKVGVLPDMLAGHSYGELAALAAAGAIRVEDLLALSRARGEHILAAAADDPGTMAAVASGAERAREALQGLDEVVIANENSPSETVIAGPTEAVHAAVARLKEAGIVARLIPVACAFHSPVVAAARQTFAEHLRDVPMQSPAQPVFCNTTAAAHPDDPQAIKRNLAEHISKPVRFCDEILAMYEAGARIFVEVGPGRVLSGLVRSILADKPHVSVATDHKSQPSLPCLLRAMGRLACHGVPVDVERLFDDRSVQAIDLAAEPLRLAQTAWLINGQRARPLNGDVPAHGLKILAEPFKLGHLVGGDGASLTPGSATEAAMLRYLDGMREMARAQRDVMLGFLGAPVQLADLHGVGVVDAGRIGAPALPAAAASPGNGGGNGTGAHGLEQPGEEASAPESLSTEQVQQLLLNIVSERTGYPEDMLDLDVDLEAELSIDSIKRIEIVAKLAERLGFKQQLGAEGDALIEELATKKTLRAILTWLQEASETLRATAGTQGAAASDGAPAEGGASDASAARRGILRYRVNVDEESYGHADVASGNGHGMKGKRLLITDDQRGVAEQLAAQLSQMGAEVDVVRLNGTLSLPDAAPDVLVHVAPLAADAELAQLGAFFALLKDALLRGVRQLLVVSGLGGRLGAYLPEAEARHGAGLAGLIRTVRKEWPDITAHWVDLDLHEPAEKLARHVVDELVNAPAANGNLRDVGYTNGRRTSLRLVEAPLNGGGHAVPPALTADSVVLLTGGARGITSQVARALAAAHGCRLVLVGRTSLPQEDEPEATRQARDATELRRLLLSGADRPNAAEVDRQCARILAAREIRSTLEDLSLLGVQATYHAADVRDRDAFGAFIDEVYERYGRLDGVVHGAGVLADKLIRDKSSESFARVFETKVNGALALCDKLRPDVGFVSFFSSVAAVFGNRGQADYAAANDVLDKLATALKARIDGRVVSVAWGPWQGTGMVSPVLEKEYHRRGIGLIPVETGVAAFLEELRRGEPEATQVVLMCATPEVMR